MEWWNEAEMEESCFDFYINLVLRQRDVSTDVQNLQNLQKQLSRKYSSKKCCRVVNLYNITEQCPKQCFIELLISQTCRMKGRQIC